MQSLSLVIITFNEEKNLRDCILSAKNICNEIIVLDSGSSDGTQQIATSLGATVHLHPFDGHIQQKNRARKLAHSDWVLSLDADERLSPELATSIKAALSQPFHKGYSMNRLNHYCGKPIKTCGWYPDTKLRLWQKNAGTWTGTNPHDRFELIEGTAETLNGDILHFTYPSKEAMLNQVNKFAGIAAEQNRSKSIFYLLYKLIFSGIFKFIRTYFLQRGFTNGRAGWEICTQQSREVFLKYYWAIKLKFGTHT